MPSERTAQNFNRVSQDQPVYGLCPPARVNARFTEHLERTQRKLQVVHSLIRYTVQRSQFTLNHGT